MNETKTPGLSAALVKCQGMVKAAFTSTKNEYDKYKYSTIKDYYDVLKPALKACGLATIFEQNELIPMENRTTAKGNTEYVIRIKLKAIIIHESGEQMVVYGFGEGQDRGDKALYKAITGGKKYLLSSIYGIPTTDDPEVDSHDGPVEPQKQRPAAQTGPGKPGMPPPPATSRPPAQKPPARPTDEAQKAAGLIMSAEVDMLGSLAAEKKISPAQMAVWLMGIYGLKNRWQIKAGSQYKTIVEYIRDCSEDIKNYRVKNAPVDRQPGQDDDEPLPEPPR
jgi:ERF superfamily.